MNKKSSRNHNNQQLSALGALWPYVRQHYLLLMGWLFFVALSTIVTLTLPIAARNIVVHGFESGHVQIINRTFAILLVLVMILAVSTAARYYCISLLGERAIARLRDVLYRHLIRLDVAFYEENRVGELISRLGTDTEVVQTLIGGSIATALRGLVTVIGSSAMMVWTSPKLAGMTAIVIPAVILPLFFYGKHLTKLSRANQDRVADISAIANETLNAIRTVKAFSREGIESSRYADAVKSVLRAARNRIAGQAILTGGVVALIFGAIVIVLWGGARSVASGTLNSGQLIQFVMYAVVAASSVGALGQVWGYVLRASGSMGRIKELLNNHPSIVAPDQPDKLPNIVRGAIEFDNVTFYYPTRPETAAIQDFSLRVKPGETIAFVGSSGAGKSTVFHLLTRFYDPQQGTITLDGVDLRLLSLEELRGVFALVPQDMVIFSASASDNIRFGRPNACEAEVDAAARAAEAYNFLRELPKGLDTELGERGMRLSGGQRQRIAIARAIVKSAPVLLLDEATSNLDAQSEAAIQIALERAKAHRTTLVIAHRLSTVLNSDRIVVMDHGHIVAIGNHDTLLRQNSLYAELVRLQLAERYVA